MNPEDRLRLLDEPERWDLPIRKRTDAFPPRRRPSPFAVSAATIAAVAVVGIVVLAGFGSGVRTVLHSDPVAPAATSTPVASTVPWVYQPASITPDGDSVSSVVPLCAAGDLSLDSAAGGVEGRASSATVGMFVVVSGTSACSLDISQLEVSAGAVTAKYAPQSKYVAPVVSPGATLKLSAVFDESCTTPGAQVSLAHFATVTATFAGEHVYSDGSTVAPSNYSCGAKIEYTPPVQAYPIPSERDGYAIVDDSVTVSRGATSARLVVRFDGDPQFDYPNCPVIIAGSSFGDTRAAVVSTLPCNSPARATGLWTFDVPIPAGASGIGDIRWSLPGLVTLRADVKIN